MKIATRVPASSDKKHLDLIREQWVPLKEPKSVFASMLLSIPIMVAISFITLYITSLFIPLSLKAFGLDITDSNFYISLNLLIIPGIFLLLVTHEFLHLVMVPDFLRSNKTFVGLSYFGAFVFSEEIITRRRFIAIAILPFITISIVLPVLLGALGLYSPLMIFLAWANSVGSSVDLLNIALVLSQAPPKSHLTSNGMSTYWKAVDARKR